MNRWQFIKKNEKGISAETSVEKNTSWNHQVWNLNSPAELNMPWQSQWTWRKVTNYYYMLKFPKGMLLAIVNIAGYYWESGLILILIFLEKYYAFFIAKTWGWIYKIHNNDLKMFSSQGNI